MVELRFLASAGLFHGVFALCVVQRDGFTMVRSSLRDFGLCLPLPRCLQLVSVR